MTKKFIWIVGVVLASVIGGWWWEKSKVSAYPRDFRGRPIPPQGLLANPDGALNPGDPGNAKEDFVAVHAAIVRFRQDHRRFPTAKELIDECGLPTETWYTDDERFADSHVEGSKNPRYQFAYLAPRPDGTQKPAFPEAAHRDVWLVCDLYVRRNERIFQDLTISVDPKGSYVVLWSDGRVEEISPLETIRFTDPTDGRATLRSFRGQAGLPKDAVTELEFLKRQAGVRIGK